MDYEEAIKILPKKSELSWEEIEQALGKELSEKVKRSSFLIGITVRNDPKHGFLIPREDIIHAILDVTNKYYDPVDWD